MHEYYRSNFFSNLVRKLAVVHTTTEKLETISFMLLFLMDPLTKASVVGTVGSWCMVLQSLQKKKFIL